MAQLGPDIERQRGILASARYHAGDPEAVVARYRIHFKPAIARAECFERLMAQMEAAFIDQGREGIVKARAIEERLMRDTWQMPGYDLLPKHGSLRVPTLVVAGDQDFIPTEVAGHIANAIPGARLVTVKGGGHFLYLECPDEVRQALDGFFRP